MDVRVFTEPQQGASYETLLAVARAAADAGFEGFFRSDHILKMGDVDGLPGPTDAWATLAGLARETTGITLGTLVSPATFREPAMLAITVAQVDAMSGGRIELGMGAGWYEPEHRSHGLDFPDLRTRFDRLDEQLAIITGMWDTPVGDTFDFAGRHYRLEASPALPKPSRRPPLIVGGRGPKRTPALVAAYADEYNQAFGPLDDYRRQADVVRRACEAAGRDPGSVLHSAALVVCCGSDDAEIERRAANMGRRREELAANGLCGTPAQIVDRIDMWRQEGMERLYMQVLDLTDLDHVALLGAEVLPRL